MEINEFMNTKFFQGIMEELSEDYKIELINI